MSDPTTHAPVPVQTDAPQPAPPLDTFRVFCFPRSLCLWPLVLVVVLVGLLNTVGAVPDSVSGVVLHAMIILSVVVREFDFKHVAHLIIAMTLVFAVVLVGLTGGLLPPLSWFAAAGTGCALTGVVLIVLLSVHLVLAGKGVRFSKRDGGTVYVSGPGISGLLHKDAEVSGKERDVAESLLASLRLRKLGDVKIVQPAGKLHTAFVVTLEGVLDPESVASQINAMLH